jgi:tRNA pseudouridine55 synthase
VHRFELLRREGERAEFEIECSSGTYVRSLIADLGDAYCEQLRRTAIGPFRVEQADPDRVIGLDEALAFLPEVRLEDEAARQAGHGRPVPGAAAGTVRLTDAHGLIALAEPARGAAEGEPELLKPVVGFRG